MGKTEKHTFGNSIGWGGVLHFSHRNKRKEDIVFYTFTNYTNKLNISFSIHFSVGRDGSSTAPRVPRTPYLRLTRSCPPVPIQYPEGPCMKTQRALDLPRSRLRSSAKRKYDVLCRSLFECAKYMVRQKRQKISIFA